MKEVFQIKIVIKIFLSIIFLFYLIVLSKLILFKHLNIQDVLNHFTFNFDKNNYLHENNFVPFKTIIYYLFLATDINLNMRIENLIGNIIGFIPFGFILPLLLKKFQNFIVIGITTFCFSLSFELTQLIFRLGSFDIDDLILNTLGGVLGYLPIYFALLFINYKRISKEEITLKNF